MAVTVQQSRKFESFLFCLGEKKYLGTEILGNDKLSFSHSVSPFFENSDEPFLFYTLKLQKNHSNCHGFSSSVFYRKNSKLMKKPLYMQVLCIRPSSVEQQEHVRILSEQFLLQNTQTNLRSDEESNRDNDSVSDSPISGGPDMSP